MGNSRASTCGCGCGGTPKSGKFLRGHYGFTKEGKERFSRAKRGRKNPNFVHGQRSIYVRRST